MVMDIFMPVCYFNWIDGNPEWPCVLGKDFKCNIRAMLQSRYEVPEKQCREFQPCALCKGWHPLGLGEGVKSGSLCLAPALASPGQRDMCGRGLLLRLFIKGPPSCTCLSIPPPQRGFLKLGGRLQLPLLCL